MSVEYNDLDTMLRKSILVNASWVYNPTMLIFIISVLPLGPEPDSYKYAHVKIVNIKEVFSKCSALGNVKFNAELVVMIKYP